MTLLDTLNGVAMTHAYGWALHNPLMKRTYNLWVTGLSGLVALVIGAMTLAQWAGQHFPAASRALAALQGVDMSSLGFWLAGLTVGLFLIARLQYRAHLHRSVGQVWTTTD